MRKSKQSNQDKSLKGKDNTMTSIIWFRGERVKLDGTKEILYGGVFWHGKYLTGSQKGKEVLVADTLIKQARKETQ